MNIDQRLGRLRRGLESHSEKLRANQALAKEIKDGAKALLRVAKKRQAALQKKATKKKAIKR